MSQANLLKYFPDIRPDEMQTLLSLLDGMNEMQQSRFLSHYQSKRRDRTTMLILAAIGLVGVAGVHRLVTGDMLMGILYLLTSGFCFIGTIIDLINIGNITDNYNRRQAREAAQLVQMVS